MRNRAAQAVALLLPAILAVFVVRNLPLLANRDDFLRLYFGGYVGCATLRGGERAALVQAEVAAAGDALAGEYEASRFKVAQTPYAPLTLALVCAAEVARAGLSPGDLAAWALGVQTAAWLALLGAAAALARFRLPRGAPFALAVAGLSLVWMHVHTSPLLPAPRAVAGLGTALALALVLSGRAERWAYACVAVAALSHPYNQAINLAVAVAFVLAVGGTAAAAGCRPAMAARVAVVASLAIVTGYAVVRLANPRPGVSVDELWGYRHAALAVNWGANGPAVRRLVLAVGLPLAALVFRYAGAARAAAVGALFVVTVALPALVWPAGLYPGEMSNRVGGAWVAALLALCLRGDLLPDVSRMSAAAAAALLATAGAGAVPEAAGIRNAPHWAPWLRQPRVETRPGAERACLEVMARTAGR
jgi:hypothetical protein